MFEVYTDVGWCAAGIALSLARIEQARPISRDRETLQAMVEALDGFAGGTYEQDDKPPLFSRIEGLLVFVRTVHEWGGSLSGSSIRQRAGSLAAMLREFLGTGRQGETLRKFFWKVHDVAEEVTATRLPFDPVVEVFSTLSMDRQAG